MRVTTIGLFCVAAASMLQPTQAQTPQIRVAEAVRTIDLRLRTLDANALVTARTSGSRFPSYNRWIGELASAVRSGMNPAKLSRSIDSTGAVPRDADALLSASDGAAAELTPFIAAPPQSRDLYRIAAYKQNTQPRKLAVVLLTDFFGKTQSERTAAADRLKAAYALPQ